LHEILWPVLLATVPHGLNLSHTLISGQYQEHANISNHKSHSARTDIPKQTPTTNNNDALLRGKCLDNRNATNFHTHAALSTAGTAGRHMLPITQHSSPQCHRFQVVHLFTILLPILHCFFGNETLKKLSLKTHRKHGTSKIIQNKPIHTGQKCR